VEKSVLFACIMIVIGFIAMRFVGRKSLSKMTIAQSVIMIAIGSILVEPVKQDDVMLTIISISVFVIVLLLLEWLTYYSEKFEKWFIGDRKVIIENGVINQKNIKKLRMTNDILEMTLRTKGISNFEHVKRATLEANGHIGYEMKDEYKSVNRKELDKKINMLMDELTEANFRLKKITNLLEGDQS
jgi:uncharacterized membrane protein YcaP (DUF421 family)